MTTPLRRRIRHTRRWMGYGFLVLLILVALLVGVANQLLPMVERHPDRIADWLSARVGEPVSFSRASGEWTRRGPRFILDDLHVGKGANQLAIGRAQLQVAMYSGLLPGRPLTELKIRDLSLTLVQAADGRWKVIGLPGQGGRTDPLDRLDGFGELQIEKAKLAIRAPRLKLDMHIPRIDARIRVNGSRLRVGVSAWVDAQDQPVSAVLDFQRNSRDGLLWVGGEKLQLAHWAPLFATLGVLPEQGAGEIGLWASLDDQRVSQVTVEADVEKARMRSLRPLLPDGAVDGSPAAPVEFDRLQATARWTALGEGWRIRAPRLNVSRQGKVAHLDGLVIDGGERYALTGKELDLSPLAAMLSLSDRLPAPVRLFLQQADPGAVLREVSIHGRRHGPLRGSMLISRLSLQPSGQRPGLSGVSGQLQFDEAGGVLRLDSGPVHVSWPAALRQPLDVRLGGTLAFWKNGAGWTVGTSLLRISGSDFGARLRMQLGFQGDGTAPTLDLAADLDPASFATAKKFWIINKMPASSVQWLDNALLAGDVLQGRIAIGGDLDDWPFRNHAGSFDARANIRNASLKFNDRWPPGQAMDIDVAFDGPGFSLVGRGAILGNEVASVSGGIADFHLPWLDLAIKANGSGEKLRQLMIASPLNQEFGEHLRAVSIKGATAVDLLMRLPLHEGLGEKRIEGTLDLRKAALSDTRWDILFTDVSGRTRFTQAGFATENLKVRLAGQPGVFNLRVGEPTGDKATEAIATLDGRFTAATLIDRYQDLAWLRPSMSGSANWKLSVRIPAGSKTSHAPSQLKLGSDLVGIAMTLPAPLKKAEQAAMPMELQASLPIEQGEINLRLAELMRMRMQIRKGAPMAGAMQFGEGALPALPAAGLSIRGSVGTLDSTGWVGFSGSGESSATVHDVDVQAAQLIFIDRAFADSRLRLDRSAAATQILIKGKGIDGSIEVPGEISRGVQGKFASLYLPSDAADGSAPAPPSSVEVDDPSKLPPLRFTIADLRLGAAQLGKAELVTTPIANGLRVDKFQTQARNLSLNAAGEWVRANGGTRSNFKLDFNANSLGQMLDALGYMDMVEGGKTKATLAGSWPGSPGAFGLATLSGTLKAEVGEGRLLEVEPGGSGRILGLISLAEIPRRLSLDFSDFFKKGFAFNTAKGDFVFSDGKARTDNLRIDGPAAEIRVSGATGLRDKVYDQRVEVLPKAGGVLPAIGFLAGGPAGAAVGAMAQAVLQRPLKQTTRVVYRISGPWEKPVVTVIEKGPDKSQPAPGARATPPAGQP